MTSHFTIDLLPALEGDSIWIEWGDGTANGRMLIDGGRGSSKNLNPRLAAAFAARPPSEHRFDLVVNTHMDADHIAGMIGLFNDPPDHFSTGEIWFNGLSHMPPPPGLDDDDDGVLSVDQADVLEELLQTYLADKPDTGWNRLLSGGDALVIPDLPAIDDGADPPPLPKVCIAGLEITLLSPTFDRLRGVADEWDLAAREAKLAEIAAAATEAAEDEDEDEDDDTLGFDEDDGIDPAVLATRPYERDTSPANGASIAFMVEFAGKRVLLAADAHAEVLTDTLRRLQPDGTIAIDAIKLSHHGSNNNLSPELLAMVDCSTWLISTNGSRHHHPDRRAIARLITRSSADFLVFNYWSRMTKEWGDETMRTTFGFRSYLPPENKPGTRYDVLADEAGPLP